MSEKYKFRMHKKRPEIFFEKKFDVTIDITSAACYVNDIRWNHGDYIRNANYRFLRRIPP